MDINDAALQVVIRAGAQGDVAQRLLGDAQHHGPRGDVKIVRSSMLPYFRDLRDKLTRFEDSATGYHERLLMAFDIYLNKSAFEANEGIKFLTALTAITIPVMVVGTWYGMNFEHMPELKWRFGYYWALALMLAVPGTLIYWFRRKGWLR